MRLTAVPSSELARMNLPEKVYTEKDITRARVRGKVIGGVQGGGIVLGGALLWNLLGWIPVALGVGAVLWVGYKLMSRSSSKDADADSDLDG